MGQGAEGNPDQAGVNGALIQSPLPEVLARLGEPRRTRAGTRCLWPSFEARRFATAPQDEVGVGGGLPRMTSALAEQLRPA